MMTMDEERDARFAAALSMVAGNESEEELASLRMFAGTASGMYRPGHPIWNWFWDAEYVADFPPYIVAIGVTVVGGLTALAWWAISSVLGAL